MSNINDKERRARFIVFGVIFLVSLMFFVTCIEKNWLGWAFAALLCILGAAYAIFSSPDEDEA